MYNILKVNNKTTRTTSLTYFEHLWTYFTPFSIVSIVDFEQVIVSWVTCLKQTMWTLEQRMKYVKSILETP